ncbi:hypothetical protein DFQ12_4329 [Sphingobacterium detergens]|uniref:Uncharacterized protein n=1 Tax=Sphingobacterium detergens TaxID=1145106 RepID=A0A420ARY0_SPHD1|nr:hypothetical protein DFQ12_4329 [Sphingobacterium detergens]
MQLYLRDILAHLHIYRIGIFRCLKRPLFRIAVPSFGKENKTHLNLVKIMNERKQLLGLPQTALLHYSTWSRHLPFYEIFMNFIKNYSVIFIIRLFLYPMIIQRDNRQDLILVGSIAYLLHNLSAMVEQCQGIFNSYLLVKVQDALPVSTILTCTKHL